MEFTYTCNINFTIYTIFQTESLLNLRTYRHQNKVTVKVTVLLINNFIGAKVYCLKVALLCLFCIKWT